MITSSALRRLATTCLLLAAACAEAIDPLTPRLTPESHTELATLLAGVSFPEVGRNSVVIALTRALGDEPQRMTYEYDEPYPQLPRVTARSEPRDERCSAISLKATYARPAPLRVRLEGVYCLQGNALWQARQQTVTRE